MKAFFKAPSRKRRRKMKIKTLFASLLVAGIRLACADQSYAQLLDQNGPLGIIGWSSSAPLCQVLPGSAASFINYSAPSSVSFAANSYGTIGLICNMPGIMNGLTPNDINDVAFTFSNPNASSGCTASVQLVDRTTATPVYSWATPQSTSYNGIWTVNAGSQTIGSLNAGHTYDVEMYLYRPNSLSGVSHCNPTVYAVFLESFLE
jgi:hypothetical protein